MTPAPRPPLSEAEIERLQSGNPAEEMSDSELLERALAELRALRAVAAAARAVKAASELPNKRGYREFFIEAEPLFALIDALAALDTTKAENRDAG